MNKTQCKELLKKAYRQYARVLAFAVLGAIIGAQLMNAFVTYQNRQTTQSEVIEVAKHTFERSIPTKLRIPKIALDTVFEAPLGLNDDLTVEVPDLYTTVGWYKNGATPGEIGPAVVLGHVDSFKGPAIFYKLTKLEKGDTIEIEREDGTTAVFEVEELGRYAREEFPTERVYGPSDEATLRLVTCAGIFNRGKQEYSHNLVVYARLKE